MTSAKRLNLSTSHDDDESSSVSSSNDEQEQHEKKTEQRREEEEEESSSEEGSDEDFELPPGFESVKGSGAVTREAVMSNDQELWFFKLPKNLDASALANVTVKVRETNATATRGEILAKITAGKENKKYLLQGEDPMLTDQLVNALPLASDHTHFMLGKPFSRCFSLVEDHTDVIPVVIEKKTPATTSPIVKKHVFDSENGKLKKAKHKR